MGKPKRGETNRVTDVKFMSEEECRNAFKASSELLEEKCGGGVTNECKTALQAATGLIGEKCAVSKTVMMYGAEVTVPSEVLKIASSNPELTREERVKAVSEIPWAREWARGMCTLVSPELTGKKREACVDRMARTLAEKSVG